MTSVTLKSNHNRDPVTCKIDIKIPCYIKSINIFETPGIKSAKRKMIFSPSRARNAIQADDPRNIRQI
jgi:hypothetical protein